jgi:p-aminobenzoyl-glutamate transporter AbgT
MATQPTGQSTNRTATPLADQRGTLWAGPLAVAAAVVFCISSVFPVVAGFVHDRESWPKWWGVLDVGIAFVLVILVFAVMALAYGKVTRQAEQASYRAYRILIHAIFALLVVFFLFGDGIVWINCLTGYAWRFWLLLYCLPEWFTAFADTASE